MPAKANPRDHCRATNPAAKPLQGDRVSEQRLLDRSAVIDDLVLTTRRARLREAASHEPAGGSWRLPGRSRAVSLRGGGRTAIRRPRSPAQAVVRRLRDGTVRPCVTNQVHDPLTL